MPDALAPFHPLVRRWFETEVGEPTAVQAAAWPVIVAGEHALVTAPTGSGKTLTAFLFALDRLATGAWEPGAARVLYISPLKALNNDIQRNLLTPLAGLKRTFQEAGTPFPDVGVLTRSGDTPQSERRRMLRRPPEILITTPESLNLLLSSHGGQRLLTALETVVLDEIHAVADSKRGTHLITAVERLTALSGEFQRVALSATVRPLDRVAAFVGGYRRSGVGNASSYTPRPVRVVEARMPKRYDLQVAFPRRLPEDPVEGSVWPAVVRELKRRLTAARSTLVFCNNRALTERLTLLLNRDEPAPVAYAHHGALSRELRFEVEARLKRGELKAIVATASLELGIDVGAVEQVVLVQTPPSVAAALQRLGRAGHRVGEASRGVLLATYGQDALDGAVLARMVAAGDIEEVRPIRGALDVLAQVLVSMTGLRGWDIDELYATVCESWPYQDLPRNAFDLVLEMLAGRFENTRVRELRPRVSIDHLENTAEARRGALQVLYASGGTIPNRGYYQLRHASSRARIGELDEEFVWEARLGDSFTLGSQTWRIEGITHNDVLVLPAARASGAPFWKGESLDRDGHFAEAIADLLERADSWLADGGAPDGAAARLAEALPLERGTAVALAAHLERQRAATLTPLPHRHHLVVERVEAPWGDGDALQVILHTQWGGRVNRPFALALAAAWEQRFGHQLEVVPNNDAVGVMLPSGAEPEALLGLVTEDDLDGLLRAGLGRSGFFGARFREAAGRALLVTRAGPQQRLPLWVTRLRAQKLLSAVWHLPDFPVLLETWRTCLQDAFDLDVLRARLAELRSGAVRVSYASTAEPSPFAGSLVWGQTNNYMYMDDAPGAFAGAPTGLSQDLLAEVARSPELRPTLPGDLVAAFEGKRQRLEPGYQPESVRELFDWAKERVLLPEPEWRELAARLQFDPLEALEGPLTWFDPPGAEHRSVIALEDEDDVRGALGIAGAEVEPGSLEQLVGQWLQAYGPVPVAYVQATWGLSSAELDGALDALAETGTVLRGAFTGERADEVCDAENLRTLLGMLRRHAAPTLAPLPPGALQPFLAHRQRVGSASSLGEALEPLLGFPAPAELWESEILPARVAGYGPRELDALAEESGLMWLGVGERAVTLALPDEAGLLSEPVEHHTEGGRAGTLRARLESLFPDPLGRYGFETLLERAAMGTAELTRLLWSGVWASVVANDALAALRQGIASGFEPAATEAGPGGRSGTRRAGPGRGRAAFARWRSTRPFTGSWRLLEAPPAAEDPLAALERDKERARMVLERYGVVFRELLERELEPLRWSRLFRALRLMELSGEVAGGHFFEGVRGLQFADPHALAELRAGPPEGVFWLNATDPAAVTGLGLEGLGLAGRRGRAPARVPSTHIAFRGQELIVVSHRQGAELEIAVPPDDADLPRLLGFLPHLVHRAQRPRRHLTVRRINGEPAATSAYRTVLERLLETTAEGDALELFKRY